MFVNLSKFWEHSPDKATVVILLVAKATVVIRLAAKAGSMVEKETKGLEVKVVSMEATVEEDSTMDLEARVVKETAGLEVKEALMEERATVASEVKVVSTEATAASEVRVDSMVEKETAVLTADLVETVAVAALATADLVQIKDLATAGLKVSKISFNIYSFEKNVLLNT